jgi:sugar phosphate permease
MILRTTLTFLLLAVPLSAHNTVVLINTLIPLYGWRWTYVILGAMVLGVMIPLGWIFTRDRPEDHGLLPDGAGVREGGQEADGPLETNWSLAQVLRCRAFWVTTAGMSSMSMLNTGLFFHIFSVFEDGGLSSTVAASVFVPIATTGAVVQLIAGLLVGRLHLRVLLAVALILEAAILVTATRLTSVPLAYAFGVGWEIQGGIEILVMGVIFANYFGRLHLGAIAGFDADGHCPRPDRRLQDRPDRLRHRAFGTGPGLSALRQAADGVTSC